MLTPLFVVLGLTLGWSIYWLVAAGWAEKRAYAERQVLSSKGIEIVCNHERWAGFPFRFEFNCGSPVLSVENRLIVQSGNLMVIALAYNPWHLIALIDGPTTVEVAGKPEQHLDHGRVIGSLQIRGEHDFIASVEVPRMTSEHFGSWSDAIAHVRSLADSSLDLAATVKEVDLRTNSPQALHIDEGTFSGHLDPSLKLNIERIDIKHKDVAYWGSGTLELDPERRPQGNISTETNNLSGLLEIIVPQLKLSDQQIANLKLILSLLGKTGNTGKINMIAREGEFYIGPFKAGTLSPLY
jgi:hypothetical protein